jgi:hypothetical protein
MVPLYIRLFISWFAHLAFEPGVGIPAVAARVG